MFILHGLFGSLDNWRTVATRISARYTVYTVDLRNHGRSPHAAVHSYPALADDVRELMDAENARGSVVVGHSMGARAAMTLALETPEYVSALVAVDMAPGPSAPTHNAVFAALRDVAVETVASRAEAEARLSASIPNDMATVQFLLKGLYRKEAAEGGGFGWRFNLSALEEQYPEILKAAEGKAPFLGPTCFMRGEKSDYVRPQDELAIRALFPAAQIVTVPQAGHWIHAEKPEGFLAALGGFLNVDF